MTLTGVFFLKKPVIFRLHCIVSPIFFADSREGTPIFASVGTYRVPSHLKKGALCHVVSVTSKSIGGQPTRRGFTMSLPADVTACRGSRSCCSFWWQKTRWMTMYLSEGLFLWSFFLLVFFFGFGVRSFVGALAPQKNDGFGRLLFFSLHLAHLRLALFPQPLWFWWDFTCNLCNMHDQRICNLVKV